ncbi:hydrogenase maturation protease [Cytobacillus firmus]|uniref:hydrogenase maturation protease n=1 Tax=Cytobacillus TaxID=2675230 RepID=UPI0018CD1573|nr:MULTISPECIES: hydrogenase maturation protease [Cytobacillus]MBG9450710.1 hydrogenase maturation protease [Cytobacillus firmus]MCC3646145.1 hydrogenase maturation protease [Cytobacillus oceanisediminis]WHY63975.1 hydrogenase maturation protease [Cytobacillus firmus]
MKKTIILGIGNRLMKDDGVGIYIAEELMNTDENLDCEYIIGESDIDYSLSKLEGAEFVIILDAILSGGNPGDIEVYSLDKTDSHRFLGLSPHNMHLFQALYEQRDKLKGCLIGVEPFDISFQIGLSRELEKKWPEIVSKAKKTIDEILSGRG